MMRSRIVQQLNTLNTELTDMGALCEEAISSAVKYLTDGDEEMRKQCIDADCEIDRMEREIEALCMKLLLQQQPVARDLRVISSALKIISDMERIGDQAADIVEISPYIKGKDIVNKTHIAEMAEETIRMVTDSVDSFVKNDMKLAYEAINRDDRVDDLFDAIKKELIDAVSRKSGDAEALIDLLMIAKYLERIGDHAENIAEWVIYSITGKHEDMD